MRVPIPFDGMHFCVSVESSCLPATTSIYQHGWHFKKCHQVQFSVWLFRNFSSSLPCLIHTGEKIIHVLSLTYYIWCIKGNICSEVRKARCLTGFSESREWCHHISECKFFNWLSQATLSLTKIVLPRFDRLCDDSMA